MGTFTGREIEQESWKGWYALYRPIMCVIDQPVAFFLCSIVCATQKFVITSLRHMVEKTEIDCSILLVAVVVKLEA